MYTVIIITMSVFLWLTPMSTQHQHHQPDTSEYLCLFTTIYHEARSESTVGQQWVAAVILNRSRTTSKSICYTVNKPYQFSNINKTFNKLFKTSYKQLDDETNGNVSRIAFEALYRDQRLPTSILWYHTKEINPSWSKKVKYMKKYGTIGSHTFYQKV